MCATCAPEKKGNKSIASTAQQRDIPKHRRKPKNTYNSCEEKPKCSNRCFQEISCTKLETHEDTLLHFASALDNVDPIRTNKHQFWRSKIVRLLCTSAHHLEPIVSAMDGQTGAIRQHWTMALAYLGLSVECVETWEQREKSAVFSSAAFTASVRVRVRIWIWSFFFGVFGSGRAVG